MASTQLLTLAETIMFSNRTLFEEVCNRLDLSKKDIIEAFDYYNTYVFEIENSVYEKRSIRAAMFIEYLIEGSWHQQRQSVLLDFLNYFKPKTIIDIGFGTPTKYVQEYCQRNKDVQLTLADKFQSAFDFAEVVLDCSFPGWTNKITFTNIDLDAPSYIGDYEAYIFQDTIEHSICPRDFLLNTVTNSGRNSIFLLSIPIAPLIPCHHIHWQTKMEALRWLQSCSLKILHLHEVFVNPLIDEFAKDIGEISNLMVAAQRND